MSEKDRHGVVEAALARRETYELGFKRQSVANLMLTTALVVMTGLTWAGWSRQIETRYFALAENGTIMPIIPISEPHYSNGQVTNFAVEAITKALTMNFATWKQDMMEASDYFEQPQGFENFVEVMTSSGMLDLIRNRRVISTVVANGGMIVQAGLDNGVYTWVVQVPITITYQSNTQTSSENRVAEVRIKRLSTWQTPRGMGISAWHVN